MVSHWSLNYDENVFDSPKSFVADRFLEKDGKSVSKIQQNIMPFQVSHILIFNVLKYFLNYCISANNVHDHSSSVNV